MRPDKYSKWHFTLALLGTMTGLKLSILSPVVVVLFAEFAGFLWEIGVDEHYKNTRDSRMDFLKPDKRGFDWGDILANTLGILLACLFILTSKWS